MTLQSLIVIWLVTAAGIILHRWRAGHGMGLVVAFVLSLSSLHCLAAILYTLPWYEGLDRDDVTAGLRIATVALIGAGVGVVGLSRWLEPEPTGESAAASLSAPPIVGVLYLLVGASLYVGALSGLRSIPSIGGIASAGSSVAIFGACLLLWHTSPRRRILWLSLSVVLPLITILAQGYLSYGIAALVMIVAFVAERHRPRWTLVVAGTCLSYLALSFYVTYMRDRREIREAVWNGASAGARLSLVANTVGSIEPFDPLDNAHLARVDDRLNQDYLVGRAVAWINDGFIPFGRGRTLVEASLALVPRALWPNKAVSAGSGDLVSQYTGMQFNEDTSVGIGQVMELYVNFGTVGVFLGFVVLGGVVLLFDDRAGRALERGDMAVACRWYLPGLSLLQVNGSFVDVTATMGAALVCAVIANTVIAAARRSNVFGSLRDDEVALDSRGIQTP